MTIQAGEPIALYLGDLTDEISLESERRTGNTYLYALSRDEMSARGYTAPAQLRVDASRAGAEARFINDCWAPPGLPTRTPNPHPHPHPHPHLNPNPNPNQVCPRARRTATQS